jgi:hypothetical protein
MALIAGDQIVRACGVGTFEENIIGGVERDLKRAGGRDEMAGGRGLIPKTALGRAYTSDRCLSKKEIAA